MHLSHLFNLIQINYKTPFISVIFFDAFSAEHGQMLRTIEVLDSLVMLIAQKTVDAFFVFEVDISQNWIPFNNFI